jgi:hypothetical protein
MLIIVKESGLPDFVWKTPFENLKPACFRIAFAFVGL